MNLFDLIDLRAGRSVCKDNAVAAEPIVVDRLVDPVAAVTPEVTLFRIVGAAGNWNILLCKVGCKDDAVIRNRDFISCISVRHFFCGQRAVINAGAVDQSVKGSGGILRVVADSDAIIQRIVVRLGNIDRLASGYLSINVDGVNAVRIQSTYEMVPNADIIVREINR